MEIGTYLAFLVAAVVIIVVPGPTNLTIVSDSMEAGIRRSIWTVAGAASSHALFIIAVTAGVGAVLNRYPQVFVFIKWFGVLYLVVQGVWLIIKKPGQIGEKVHAQHRKGAFRCLLKGFAINSTNPKALLFYAALFPPFVNPHFAFMPQLLVLASTFLALFVVIGTLHAVAGQKLGLVLSEGRTAKLVDTVSGSVMVGAAVWMAIK